jgi:hypothetical protein
MKNGVFWDITPCGSGKTDVSVEHITSIIRMTRIGELGTTLLLTSNRRTLRRNTMLPFSDNVVPSSPILLILLMKAIPEPSLLTRATRRNIQEEKNLKKT